MPTTDLQFHPLVIGATGGSGTRVVTRIVRRAGFFMGTHVNASEDALSFPPIYDRWINLCWQGSLPEAQEREMTYEFQQCLADHLASMPDKTRPWGFKNPRTIYLLPFLHRQFPDMKFIHLVRDGRDMALSKNQNQLQKHGHAILGDEFAERSEPIRSIALWSRVNNQAAALGGQNLRDNYLLVRFEDLCTRSEQTVQRILDFVGYTNAELIGEAVAEISPPESLGRWKKQDVRLQYELCKAGQPGLEQFDYWDTEVWEKIQKFHGSFWRRLFFHL
jgi:hypothetical protein